MIKRTVIRIQEHWNLNGNYIFHEIENNGFRTVEEVSACRGLIISVIPEEILVQISRLKIVLSSGLSGGTIYMTTNSGVLPEIFDKMPEKFFERIYTIKNNIQDDAYDVCFHHK